MTTGASICALPVAHGQARFTRPVAVVVRGQDGNELARHELDDSELGDLRAEVWLDSYLRRGAMDVPLEALSIDVTPCFGGEQTTFLLTASGPHGRQARDYDGDLVRDVAAALVHRLVIEQRLRLNDPYDWKAVPGELPTVENVTAADTPTFSLTSTSPPLSFTTAPLAPMLARAEARGQTDSDQIKVVFVQTALERAEQFARRGADRQPAVETGAAYIGLLCSCPDSGDCFVVVTDALEVFDAQQQEFSLTYNSATWQRIRGIVHARRSQPGGAALRMLGQCHGHNFLPGGGAPPCEMCATAAVCSRTSVFVSSDDRRWTRAVMSEQPWQLCHIFGFNARQEYCSELFGLRGNRLQSRGFHVIDRFEPSSSC